MPGSGEGRRKSQVHASTKQRDGRAILDIETYVPYFLASVNSALSRGASRRYLDSYGIGIVEWRVVAMLAIEPRITASRICEVVAMDKGAASRALTRLRDLGYLDFEAPDSDPRKKLWWLNDPGYDLHDALLAMALEREQQLLAGVAPQDLDVFLKVMRILRRNVEGIDIDNRGRSAAKSAG